MEYNLYSNIDENINSKLSDDNREFLKRLRISNIDSKYEVVNKLSDNLYEVVDVDFPNQLLIMKLLNMTLSQKYNINLILNSVRSVFNLLGDNYIQKQVFGRDWGCRYTDRFLCYKDFFVTKNRHNIYFVSVYEKIEGLTLGEVEQTFIDSDTDFPLEFLINIFYSLLTSLYILHSNNIYHRDIKPDNIICTNDENWISRIKLIDFDFSCGEKMCIGNPGTLTYASKYVSQHKNVPGDIWAKADIVSLAISLFKVFTTDDSDEPYFNEDIPYLDEDLLPEWIAGKCLNRELDEDGLSFSYFLVNLFDYDTNKEKSHISLLDIIRKYEELFSKYIDQSLIIKFNEILY